MIDRGISPFAIMTLKVTFHSNVVPCSSPSFLRGYGPEAITAGFPLNEVVFNKCSDDLNPYR